MIYSFRCQLCGRMEEPYVHSYSELSTPVCCDELMVRNYTPFAIRKGMVAHRTPPGVVECGNEIPKPDRQRDRYRDVERDLIQAIDSGQDLDGSGDYTLKGLKS